MTQRFIVATEKLSKDQEALFVEYLKAQRFRWWHWIENVWLLASRDGSPEIKPTDIRSGLLAIDASKNVVVLEVIPNGWAGRGPATDERSMFNWLRNNWKRGD